MTGSFSDLGAALDKLRDTVNYLELFDYAFKNEGCLSMLRLGLICYPMVWLVFLRFS